MTDCATIAEARIIASEYEGTRAVRADGGILAPNVVRFARLAVSLAAVVDALPKCRECGKVATVVTYHPERPAHTMTWCDISSSHRPAHLYVVRDLPYAAALREMEYA